MTASSPWDPNLPEVLEIWENGPFVFRDLGRRYLRTLTVLTYVPCRFVAFVYGKLIDELACYNAARVVKRHDDVKLYGKLIDQLV